MGLEEIESNENGNTCSQYFHAPGDHPLAHGYTDKKTGACFVNVLQQTDHQNQKKCDLAHYVTRETQLCEKRNQCWNTTRETWTQMDRPGLVLESKRDYELDIGPYEDSKTWEEKRNKAAIVIQKYARRRHAKCKAKKLQMYAKERLELIAQLEKKQKADEDLQLKVEVHKHKHPRKKEDFDILYEEVKAWHLEELQSIKGKGLPELENSLALQELLHKEVKFFQAIERMKLAAAKENKEDRIRTMMCRMSAPKKWELSDGRLVHVQTLDTLRASDLMRLYTALGKCSRNVDERMCVLGYIKWTVQEFDCELTKELIQLIEREADLMYRNRPTKSLQGLRQRILDLFLKFIQVPKFNPEAAAYQCVPIDFDHPSCQTLQQQSVPICLQS